MKIEIHVNEAISHQVDEARAMLKGFKKHGITASAGPQRHPRGADVNIVLGPYYSLEPHKGTTGTLYIDRGYYEWPKFNSIHWVDLATEKIWIRDYQESSRYHPYLQVAKEGRRAVVLLDHLAVSSLPVRKDLIDRARRAFGTVTIRYHPSEKHETDSLEECLNKHDVAFGHRTTALVEAALAGLEVRTKDIYSPAYPLAKGIQGRVYWAKELSWHMWTLEEMESGEVWEYFSKHR